MGDQHARDACPRDTRAIPTVFAFATICLRDPRWPGDVQLVSGNEFRIGRTIAGNATRGRSVKPGGDPADGT